MTTEQTELIEKLKCLESETSQLSRAYQLWRSYVEQGTAPDWMAAAIRITYDALITFCVDTVSALAQDPSHGEEIECYARSDETAPLLGRALPGEDSRTALRLHPGPELQRNDAETDPPIRLTTLTDRPRAITPVRQQNRIVGMLAVADAAHAFSAMRLGQVEAACEISSIWEESTTAEPSTELLPMTLSDWSGREMPVAISTPLTADAILEQPGIHPGQQEEEIGAEPDAIHSLATLHIPNWVLGSSTKLLVAASVAILLIAGGAIGIYLAHPERAGLILPVQNSAVQAAAGAVAIPTSDEAQLKFEPDPVAVTLGSSFVLNAMLSRGSDIAFVAVQIDYDANLLQFMGASEGGFLVKAGRQFVLAQRNDPLTGVLKISAEQSPGIPGISGDGPVFALSFHTRKKGKGTVSIIPSAHDSQGRRIPLAGSQASVGVN